MTPDVTNWCHDPGMPPAPDLEIVPLTGERFADLGGSVRDWGPALVLVHILPGPRPDVVQLVSRHEPRSAAQAGRGRRATMVRSRPDWSPIGRAPPSVGSASRRARTTSGWPSRRCSARSTTARSGRSSASWWGGTTGARASPAALLEAAIDYARAHGAKTLEGYPLHESRGKVASSAAYVGTQAMFERAGFTVAELRSWDDIDAAAADHAPRAGLIHQPARGRWPAANDFVPKPLVSGRPAPVRRPPADTTSGTSLLTGLRPSIAGRRPTRGQPQTPNSSMHGSSPGSNGRTAIDTASAGSAPASDPLRELVGRRERSLERRRVLAFDRRAARQSASPIGTPVSARGVSSGHGSTWGSSPASSGGVTPISSAYPSGRYGASAPSSSPTSERRSPELAPERAERLGRSRRRLARRRDALDPAVRVAGDLAHRAVDPKLDHARTTPPGIGSGGEKSPSPSSNPSVRARSTIWLNPASLIGAPKSGGTSGPGKIAGTAPCVTTTPSPVMSAYGSHVNCDSGGIAWCVVARRAYGAVPPDGAGEPLPELHPAARSATATTIPRRLTGPLPPAAYVDRPTPIVVRPC